MIVRLILSTALSYLVCSENGYARDTSEAVFLDDISTGLKASSVESRDDFLASELKQLGNKALRAEAYNEAVAFYTSASVFRPSDVWIWWKNCWALTELAQYASASVQCRRSLELLEDDSVQDQSLEDKFFDYEAVYSANAHLLRKQGRSDRTIEVLEDLFEHKELGDRLRRSNQIQMHLAHAYMDLGEYANAFEIFDAILGDLEATEDELERARLARAHINSISNASKEAIEDYAYLADKFPDVKLYSYLLCSEFIRGERWNEALIACGKTHSQNEANPIYQYSYGVSLFHSSNFSSAKPLFESTVRLRPQLNSAWIYLQATLEITGERSDITSENQRIDPERVRALIQSVN